jgi:hypothetical protein
VGASVGLDKGATGKNNLPLPGIEPESPSRPLLSQTLHLLSYLGAAPTITMNIKTYKGKFSCLSSRV